MSPVASCGSGCCLGRRFRVVLSGREALRVYADSHSADIAYPAQPRGVWLNGAACEDAGGACLGRLTVDIAVTSLVVVLVDSTSLSAAVAGLRSGSVRRTLTPRYGT